VGAEGSFTSRLAGGKRQSIGESNAVVQEVQDAPDRAAELWETISFADPLVQMRAVDALEKVSVTHPEVLAGHELEILENLSTSELPEVRWHVGLLIPRLRLNQEQMSVAVGVLERLHDDQSRIVQVNALDGIGQLADDYAELANCATRR